MAVIKHKEQRVGVFIDTQNLYHSAKNLYKRKVNFGAILKEAIAGRKLVRATAYLITTESGEEKAFFEALQKLGIETKSKDLQIFAGGAKKGDWDVGITMDCIALAPKLDVIVLCSGDGDFVPLVDYLQKSAGCRVEVMYFGKSGSIKLREIADDYFDLGEKKYLLPSRPGPAPMDTVPLLTQERGPSQNVPAARAPNLLSNLRRPLDRVFIRRKPNDRPTKTKTR